MTAKILNLLRHLAVAARRRALEHEMFEEMGEARAEPRRFVDAAGGAPELDGDDGRGEVGLDEDAEAVGQLAQLDLRLRDEGSASTRGLHLKAGSGIKRHGRSNERSSFFIFRAGTLLGFGAAGFAYDG